MGFSAVLGGLELGGAEAAVGLGAAETAIGGGLAEGVAGGVGAGAAAGGAAGGAATAGGIAAASAFDEAGFAGLGSALGASSTFDEAGFAGLGAGASASSFDEAGFAGLGADAGGFGSSAAAVPSSTFDEAGFAGVGGDETSNPLGASSTFDETGFIGADFSSNILPGYDSFASADPMLNNLEPSDPWSGDQTGAYLRQFDSQGQFPTEQQAATPQGPDEVDRTVSQEAQTGEQTGGRAGAGAGKAAAGGALGRGGLGGFNPGSLLSSLMQMGRGVPHPGSLDQSNAAAAALAAQGNLLIGQYNQGQLSGAMMSKLRMDLLGTVNKIRQQYASQGRTNSTDRIQAENLATAQASAAMAQALAQELQQGLQALGQAGQLFMSQANAEIQANNAFNQSLNNALGSILKIPLGGQGGGFLPAQQNAFAGGGGGGGGGGGTPGGGGGEDFSGAENFAEEAA